MPCACERRDTYSTGAHCCVSITMTPETKQNFSAGRYHVSPMTRLNDSGHYTALVSIRNGSHDRVFRFTPRFSSSEDAVQYALGEARSWLRQRSA